MLSCLPSSSSGLLPTLTMAPSSHLGGGLPPILLFLQTLMSKFLEDSSTIAHTFSVGAPCVLSSIHFSFLFTPQMVSSIRRSLPSFDMLGILKYISPPPISLQSLSLFLLSTRHLHGHVYMDSMHFPHFMNSNPSYFHNLHRLTS